MVILVLTCHSTLKSVIEELDGNDDNPEAQWEAIRHGSLMGAAAIRGNPFSDS